MGKLFCMMGKSASGKDTIYKALISDRSLGLHTVVPYTTRPVREGEAEGVEYWFVNEKQFQQFKAAGKIIEDRCYETVFGPWRYFMVDDGQIDFSKGHFIVIGTLESYCKIRDYYGASQVVPLYINVEDGLRLFRALERERRQTAPKYAEMCRRFLADSGDFSEEKLEKAGIHTVFDNETLETCIAQVKAKIRCYL
ncbi:MAG: guanylate kinase [Clostridiales bacterium]|nr:guanylate kinase [Clostridiales bacterium]MDY3747123.1 guanylate kinase [Lachnospiraceae bacterium]